MVTPSEGEAFRTRNEVLLIDASDDTTAVIGECDSGVMVDILRFFTLSTILFWLVKTRVAFDLERKIKNRTKK